MASSGARLFNFWAILAFAVILISGEQHASAQSQSCNVDITGLVSQCEQYVRKTGPRVAPSAGCCSVVKKVDVKCVCSLVTKEIEQMISMEKVVYVARSCGKEVSPGTKCGSYTVPGA